MGLSAGFGVSQKQEEAPAPSVLGAENGVSLRVSDKKVVLGNDIGGTDAALTNNREIPMAGHIFMFRGDPIAGGSFRVQGSDYLLDSGAGATMYSQPGAGKLTIVGSNAEIVIGNEDFQINANGSGQIFLQTNGGTNRMEITNAGNVLIIGSLTGASLQVAGAIGIQVINDTTLIHTATNLANAAGAAAGTLLNAPSAGNPTKWIQIDDNGTIRKIPTWT